MTSFYNETFRVQLMKKEEDVVCFWHGVEEIVVLEPAP